MFPVAPIYSRHVLVGRGRKPLAGTYCFRVCSDHCNCRLPEIDHIFGTTHRSPSSARCLSSQQQRTALRCSQKGKSWQSKRLRMHAAQCRLRGDRSSAASHATTAHERGCWIRISGSRSCTKVLSPVPHAHSHRESCRPPGNNLCVRVRCSFEQHCAKD